MLIAMFKHLIQQEIVALNEQNLKNNTLCNHLSTLEKTNSIEDFFSALSQVDLEMRMPIVAKSPAIHTLMIVYPATFIAFFSLNHMKAIIYQICAMGNVALVKCLLEKMVSDIRGEELMLNAFKSRSIPMVKYLLDTLKFPLYGTNEPTASHKKAMDNRLLNIVAKTGSVDMFQYLEEALKVPVDDLINEELETTRLYHHIAGDRILINAICSYEVEFLQFLFELKNLMPSKTQLTQLLGYAYESGRQVPQHKKLVTFAYVYGFTHKNARMQALLYKVAEISNLQVLSTKDLFTLFADFTQNFKESSQQFAYDKRFRENSIYLGQEIAKRKPTKQELLDIAKQNTECAADILFFLVVMGRGYSDKEIIGILQDPVFDANYTFSSGNRPLHYAIIYNRRALINVLVNKGADPDAENEAHQTPISLLDITFKADFETLLSHTTCLKNTLIHCMQIRESEFIVPLITHLHGQVDTSDVFIWLQRGIKCPTNLYNVLCNLNEITYKNVKKEILAENNPAFIHTLAYAEHFKMTGKKPKELVDHEHAQYHTHLVEMFGNHPCEARVLFGLALLSLQSDQSNPYPAFLQTLNIKKRELTAEKVAHAMWLKGPDPDQLKISKLSFSMWAKTTKLAFDIQDVEKYLGSRYSIS